MNAIGALLDEKESPIDEVRKNGIGEGEALPHEANPFLTHGEIESRRVVGLSLFLATGLMLPGRQHRLISPPEVTI